MIYIEKLPDERIHTYSDQFMIQQKDTGIIYADAVDVVSHEYEETDIPLPETPISAEEFLEMMEDIIE